MKLSNTFFIKTTLLFIGLVVSCADSKTDEPNKEKINNDIFVEVTEGRIALDGGVSRGVAWGDYDADGDPDLYVANSSGQLECHIQE